MTEYIVVVPTPMGVAFVMERGLSSEYPNAKKFASVREAKKAAAAHFEGQVFSTKEYEQGGPAMCKGS